MGIASLIYSAPKNMSGSAADHIRRKIIAMSIVTIALVGFTAPIPSLTYAQASPNWYGLTIPTIDEAPVVPTGSIDVMHKNSECVTTMWNRHGVSLRHSASQYLSLPEVHAYAQGRHQTIAVIDSGVHTTGIAHLLPGIDFVQSTDGHEDCDGQGTLIAGLLAGLHNDSVVPQARILPIRWNSQAYTPQISNLEIPQRRETVIADHAIKTLAGAIVYAADQGAHTILVSQYLCIPTYRSVDITVLRQAIHYATHRKNAVIIAASGEQQMLSPAGTCANNNELAFTDNWFKDPLRGYTHGYQRPIPLNTIVLPAWFPEVVTVAAATPTGTPLSSNITGPWIAVSAPATDIVSLSNRPSGGLSNSYSNNRGGYTNIQGSAYAAAYVAGIVALLREKYPFLTPPQIIHRLIYTAHSNMVGANSQVGYGMVDALAALTWNIPHHLREDFTPSTTNIVTSAYPRDPHYMAKHLSIYGFIASLGIAIVTLLARWLRRLP